MKVVIPMSGTGSRFSAEGYKEIKPLVPVFGKPIIEYIIKKFSQADEFIFICRNEHLLNKDLDLIAYLNSLAPNTKVLNVENHKLGPVHSLLKVQEYIDSDEELIVNYCDFDWRWNYQEFKQWISIEKPAAALCVYSGFQPHYLNPAPYAHIKTEQHNVLEIREKESFTKYREEEPAASGTFYFSSGKLLLDACRWLVKKEEKINGEFYVSLLFNYFPLKGMRTLTYFIKYFMQWGTPKDLEEFIFFAKKVPLEFKNNLISCPILTLMAGKGNRMKSIDKVKKPYLEIDKTLLFKFCTRNFQSNKDNIFALNGDEEDEKYKKYFQDSKQIFVGETKSSVETLFLAINQANLSDDDSILILSCDAVINLNWNDFIINKKNQKNCEAVVFSFSNYPHAYWRPNKYGWLKLNQDKSIGEIGYKTGWDADYSNPIVTGHFWFPNISRLKNNLKNFEISLENNKNKDMSIDEFCQYLIGNNKKVYSYEVDDFLCLGTPQEFRTYEYWIEANENSTIN